MLHSLRKSLAVLPAALMFIASLSAAPAAHAQQAAAQHRAAPQTLAQRGEVYGRFVDHAAISQSIKRAMRAAPGWQELPDDMRESLEMLAHKVARILNGNPDYVDSWHDVSGYATLVEKRLKGERV